MARMVVRGKFTPFRCRDHISTFNHDLRDHALWHILKWHFVVIQSLDPIFCLNTSTYQE
jgi:hypothetical protein